LLRKSKKQVVEVEKVLKYPTKKDRINSILLILKWIVLLIYLLVVFILLIISIMDTEYYLLILIPFALGAGLKEIRLFQKQIQVSKKEIKFIHDANYFSSFFSAYKFFYPLFQPAPWDWNTIKYNDILSIKLVKKKGVIEIIKLDNEIIKFKDKKMIINHIMELKKYFNSLCNEKGIEFIYIE
jgi:hypothetical protein